MFLDDPDYQTIWRLAHNWSGLDPENTDIAELPTDLRFQIHKIMSACFGRKISVRTRRLAFFTDDSALSIPLELHHYYKFIRCQVYGVFDKKYLDSLYVKRSDVIKWCLDEYMAPPPIWPLPSSSQQAAERDEDQGWYKSMTDARKQRVAALEMAKALWKIYPNQTYEQVLKHPVMHQYCQPTVFTLRTFKEWARPFASDFAKNGGKNKKSDS